MLTKSRALVLHTLKYNDTASIGVLFTEAAGIVSFIIRIPKSKRASNKSQLFQPLSLLQIEWDRRDNVSLQRLRQVESLYPYASLPYHPIKSSIALFLSEFLYHGLHGEQNGMPLFDYLFTSLRWLDLAQVHFTNFHLVFLMKLSRFLGFFPNTENPSENSLFDLLNSCFTTQTPPHPYYLRANEARFIPLLMRMNYETMHLFKFSRPERNRLLEVLNEYYQLHIPDFPELKSIDVLREVFN